MIEVKKTKSGWVVELTNTVNGMLESGGVAGRKWLYRTDTLEDFGIKYDDDPMGEWNNQGTLVVDYLLYGVKPDRILSHGHKIR